jgi:hypothetical protein
MTYQEVMVKINEKIERIGISKEKLAGEIQLHPTRVNRILKGDSCMIYTYLDLLDEIGLELQINNTEVIRKHQDLIDCVNKTDYDQLKVWSDSKIQMSTIRRFIRGENVQTAKVFQILKAMGLEIRVI